ncbi:hypothetical protein BGZ83_011115 [Gryganskiella cystojenkinii]|nr:hypothetical protein BGZ83_011115 [Gryganskiella cystojenkinii]
MFRLDALARLKEFRYKKQQQQETSASSNGIPSFPTHPSAINPAYRNTIKPQHHSTPIPKNEPAKILVLGSSDPEPDDDSDLDLRKGVNKLTTGSPLRRSPTLTPVKASSTSSSSTSSSINLSSHNGSFSSTSNSTTNGPQRLSTLKSPTSASASSTSSSQTKLEFSKLVDGFRYTGEGAYSNPVPNPGESDHDLSSPAPSDDDVIMLGDEVETPSRSRPPSSSAKRIMISDDEEDEDTKKPTEKPRRRLVRKGAALGEDDENDSRNVSDSTFNRRRPVKRVIVDSDDDDDIQQAIALSLSTSKQPTSSRSSSSPSKWSVSDASEVEEDLMSSTAMDKTLAQLQTTFPDASFSELRKALKVAKGDYSEAASILVSSSASFLFDLGASSPTKKADSTSPSRYDNDQGKAAPRHSSSTSTIRKPASSVSTIRKAPLASAPEKKRRPVIQVNDSSSDNDDLDDDERGFGHSGGVDRYRAQDRKEERALKFFNESTQLEFQELTGCSKSQAASVIGLRPFDNFDQLCITLRKTRGVGEKIVNNYLTTTDAIRAVDTMLKTVDRVREDLVGTLSVWCGEEHGKLFENATSSNKMEVKAAKAGDDQDGNNEDGDEDDEPGMELLNINIEKLQETPAGRKAMEGFIKRQPRNMAPGFQLKGYQLLGINWLALLWRKKLSGILADEMGLGKTAQVIAFLAHLSEIGDDGPFLIIVPSSTLSNWLREFEKFCPQLDVRSYYGSQAEREELRHELEEDPSYDVVVTTYTVATGNVDERKFLNRRGFKGIVLDEGHMVKNCTSARYKQLMSIKTPFRLLLTGTPLQNNLEELLSLMIFIMPDLFAEHEEVLRTMFKVKVDAQSEKSTLLSNERISRARLMLAPFVLRRKKIHVLKDLPRKIERVIYCDLLPEQRAMYDNIIMQSSMALQGALGGEGDDDPASLEAAAASLDAIELDSMEPKAKAKAIKAAAAEAKTKKPTAAVGKKSMNEFANVLMQLRKAADHPMLFRELYKDSDLKKMAREITKEIEFCDSNIDYVEEDMSVMTDFELHRLCKQYKSVNKFALPNDQWMHAAKVKELERLLPKLILEDKSRVLIFSQFTMVLDILESILKTMKYKYLRMDGQTKVEERQPLIDAFNDDDSHKIFLLSTKAGGFGINLTGANVVIMYDLDFNPHNDKQAEDRAHRVGQTREVEVIKLIAKDTIEEQIYQLANLKLKLDHHVSQDDAALAAAAGGSGSSSSAAGSSSSSSSSSTPSAGILSLIKQSWKATHSAAKTRQEEMKVATPGSKPKTLNGNGTTTNKTSNGGGGRGGRKSRSVSSSGSSLSEGDDSD